MDQLEGMRTFVRVVERGNFSVAARELGSTQSTVSKRIHALESKLGSRLLIRGSRRVSLTEAGQGFYERCIEILASLDEAESALLDQTLVPRGTLRINVPVAFGRLHMAPRLVRFRQLYPQIRLDVTLSDSLVDLLVEGVDLVVRIGELRDSSLIARPLGMSPRLLVAAPSYLAQAGQPNCLDDLQEHNCITHSLLGPGQHWNFYRAGKLYRQSVQGDFRCNNGDVIKDMTLAGNGLAILPVWLVQDELQKGLLVSLLAEYKPATFPINAVYPDARFVPAKVRCFIDFFREEFAKDSLFST